MAFEIVKSAGVEEIYEEVPQAAVAITKGQIAYGVSGYASNATVGNVKTHNLIGVAYDASDNSGGSVGDLDILTQVNPLINYSVGTTGTLDQTLIWTNVTLETLSTIDEDDSSDTDTGIAKMRAMISSSKARVTLNFWSPADA